MPKEIFPARYRSLPEISKFVVRVAKAVGLSDAEAYAVELAVDEACTNIIDHAYGGEDMGDIECSCVEIRDGLKVVIKDQGEPFDPGEVPSPDTDKPLLEIQARGAGLYLIRALMDEVQFEFGINGGNILTLIKHRAD